MLFRVCGWLFTLSFVRPQHFALRGICEDFVIDSDKDDTTTNGTVTFMQLWRVFVRKNINRFNTILNWDTTLKYMCSRWIQFILSERRKHVFVSSSFTHHTQHTCVWLLIKFSTHTFSVILQISPECCFVILSYFIRGGLGRWKVEASFGNIETENKNKTGIELNIGCVTFKSIYL